MEPGKEATIGTIAQPVNPKWWLVLVLLLITLQSFSIVGAQIYVCINIS